MINNINIISIKKVHFVIFLNNWADIKIKLLNLSTYSQSKKYAFINYV